MLGGDERSRDTTGHAADVPLPRLAWKTGTSSGFRDAWAVAFNPDWVIGVWIGNPDGRPADQLVGARAAVPIVWDIFRELYPDNDSPWFARPAGLKKRPVCALSGAPPGPHCPQVADDWYIEGVSRFEPCTVHRLVAVRDEAGGARVGQDSIAADGHNSGSGTRGSEPAVSLVVREVWPPEIAAFLRTREAPGAAAKETGTTVAGKGPRILTPAAGSAYRKLDDWQSDAQRVQFVADNRGGAGKLYWFVDDLPLGSAAPAQPLLWALERGRHTVICCDERGRTDRVQITVE